MSGISKGIWIDAGCGRGTFSLPLAELAARVIAIDKNFYDISFLKTQLLSTSNIEVFEKDFTKEPLFHELVDGVLFGFSLHYELNPLKALQNAFNQIKTNGAIIIFEYIRDVPLPWVPFPVPKFKLIKLLKKIGFSEIETIVQDSRFYIVRGIKPL
jgi:SAM-dependent methyltransferase